MDRTVAGIVGDQPARLEPVTEGASSTASMDPQQLWQVAQEELRFQVVRPGYEAWLANAVLVELRRAHVHRRRADHLRPRLGERALRAADSRDALRGARPRLRGRDHRRPGGVAAAGGAAASSRPDVRARERARGWRQRLASQSQLHVQHVRRRQLDRVSRTPRVAPSPRRRARRTTRCSSTAAWVSARPISCTRSVMRCARRTATRRSRTSRPRNS